jgi:hypothetical protein
MSGDGREVRCADAMSETVRQQPNTDEADCEDLEYVARTKLGQLAMAARREYVASGRRLLDRDDLEREVRERRGGTHLLSD